MSTDRLSLNERLPDDGPDYTALIDAAGFDIEPAPDAVVCGAAGCRERAQLLRAELERFGKRVLCPGHMADLVRREGDRR